MPASNPVDSRAPLSRQAIVDTAIAIADSDGLAGLSMRAVARELGVEAMSLYHHVSNKSGLLDGMVDAVFAEFHLPQVGFDWRSEMRERSETGRRVLIRHPWAVGLLDSRRNAGHETLRHHDAVLGCLREAGFSWSWAGHAFALLDAHLYGFVVQELSLPFDGAEAAGDVAAEMFDALPSGELHYLREFAGARVLQRGYSFGDEFEIGLDLILDALARELGQPSE